MLRWFPSGMFTTWPMTAAMAVSVAVAVQAASPADLISAVRQRDTDAARQLLRAGHDVNATSPDGMTALHWAAQNGDVEIARILLFAGANLRATTRLGAFTPLLIAARNGDAALVDVLVTGGADVNIPTSNGTTPLMFAAASGNVAAARTLIEHGARIDDKESAREETALDFAAAHGRTDVIRLLTAHHADVAAASKVIDLGAFTREELDKFTFSQANGALPDRNSDETKSDDAKKADARQDNSKKAEAAAAPPKKPQVGGVDRQYLYNELVGHMGGMTALLIAARQGQRAAAEALLDAGADVNQPSAGDHTTPLLIATINGHFDVAAFLLQRGADPNVAAENGVTPLYAAINCQWAPKALYPQPRAHEQQTTTYLDLMRGLLDRGADPNARLRRKVWYSLYNFDSAGLDETGATAFWRAAYTADVDAMKLLIAYGADPAIPTIRPAGSPDTGGDPVKDPPALAAIPVGAAGIPPLLAAAGHAYGESFAGNFEHLAPAGRLAAVKYLVGELHVDLNAVDYEGNTVVHNAAARGDNEMILYLVSAGARVSGVNLSGKTTVDMANGPFQRIQPFPETIALLERLGATNNHKCASCD